MTPWICSRLWYALSQLRPTRLLMLQLLSLARCSLMGFNININIMVSLNMKHPRMALTA